VLVDVWQGQDVDNMPEEEPRTIHPTSYDLHPKLLNPKPYTLNF